MSETTISVVSSKALVVLFGACDQHLRKIRDALGVTISARDGRIHVEGDEQAVASATEVLEQLQAQANRHGVIAPDDVVRALAEVRLGRSYSATQPLEVYTGRQIRPRSPGQARADQPAQRA